MTVIVVSCNGGFETLRCLNSVAAADPMPDRLVLVDSGSTDGTRTLIEAEYKDSTPLTAVWLPTNVGPAAGRNIGARQAKTKFIAFLDNDTVVSSAWLVAALDAMDGLQADCVQCKLISGGPSGQLDSLGYLLGPFGFPRHIIRPGAVDLPEYQYPRPLFGVKSAAMVMTRQAFNNAGGFDPTFFIYGEETDLCWRLLRSGGKIVLAPRSVVLHHSGGTGRFLPERASTLLYRGGTRNYIHMVAKNSPPKKVIFDLAGQIVFWLGLSVVQSVRGRFASARLIVLGVIDGLSMLPSVFRARRQSSLPYVEIPPELRMRLSVKYIWRLIKAV